ncbi:PAS domain-containing sensor histidine kinase [Spirosoma fluminis]
MQTPRTYPNILLLNGGEMGDIIRATDWSQTAIGPIEKWPLSLRLAVQLTLDSDLSMYLVWGPNFTQFYNDSFRQLLGADKHPAALGNSAKDTFAEIWDWLEPTLSSVLQGNPFGAQDMPVKLNRSGILEDCYFTFSYTPIRDEAGQIQGILVPVTETTQTVRALQRAGESERQLYNLLAQIPVAIAIFRGPAHIIELANAAHLKLWGRKDEDLTGKPFFQALPELKGQGYEELLGSVFSTGEPVYAYEQSAHLTRNDQIQTAYFNVVYQALRGLDGAISGVVVITNEVTEQVDARKKLEESETHFRELANLMPQIVWTARHDGQSDYYNQQWYEFSGLEQKAGGQDWSFILHPDDRKRSAEAWYHCIKTGEPFAVEYRFHDRRNPGTYRWFLGRATPVRDANGNITKWFGSATDIDDQKRLAELLELRVSERTQELSLANNRLERSNFDLMQFASVASHDLKEPLRKIQMFGNLLRSTADEKLTATERDYFNRMISTSNRMQDLVDDVLNLSKLSNHAMFYTETDLNAVISSTLDDLEITIQERGATINVGPLSTIEANTGQIRQLFQNLLSNALKFCSADRTPVIAVQQVFLADPEASLIPVRPDNYVCIQVADNGIGFDKTYQEKIFGLFQRLHGGRYRGTGIGLAICKKIIENHQGFIRAEGTPNEGATFTITLPLKQE